MFRDLTVLVGAQGTGKSLVLPWLKAAIDGKYIVQPLREAGQEVSRKTLIDLIFGVGMRSAWRETSQVQFDGKEISPTTIERRGDGVERLFFIPAHRVDFAPHDKTINYLDQNGVQFVGSRLEAKHLASLSKRVVAPAGRRKRPRK